MSHGTPEPQFDIAVSFAGEDRAFVEDVVRGIDGDRKVFYDEDFLIESWGRDLVEYFTHLYQHQARYVVMFISAKYAEKSWTTLERRSALAGALLRQDPYILPVRLDDTELPGLLPTVGYIDARRVGVAGIVGAINAKLAGTQISLSARPPLLDGKVPRSAEAVQALIAEKPPAWEYQLYAALLMANVGKLENKYRDHSLRYARPNGRYVSVNNLNEVVQGSIGSVLATVNNFNAVLDPRAQEAAFGRPGEPGNVELITHMAERFTSVYEELLDWSAELRGLSARGEHTQQAIRLLSDYTSQPIESIRSFLRDFVSQVDGIQEKVLRGENVNITMTIKIDLDPNVATQFQRQVKLAYKRERT